jgi:WD40 repeat protein
LGLLEGHTGAIAEGVLAFSPDGKRLSSASHDWTARLWDVATRKSLRTIKSHTDEVYSVVFSPDGKQVATASKDNSIILWDADTGEPQHTFTGHHNMVFTVAFDATGRRLLSAGRDRTLRLWDVATGVTLRVYQGHTAALGSVVRHGDTLYTAALDQTVHRWSLATPGQWMWELPEEAGLGGN